MFQMPLSRLSVRPADLRPVLFHQSANGRVTVHRLEHLQARAIQPHDRQVVIEGREPPFVFTVLTMRSGMCQARRLSVSPVRLSG